MGCSAKKTFSNLGLNGWNRKNVRYSTETGHISEAVKNKAKITINH